MIRGSEGLGATPGPFAGNAMAASMGPALPMAHWLAAAEQGEADACFSLGVAFSTGDHGAPCDLVEAHKWFNLAAAHGHEEAPAARAEVAEDMSAREIAEAQRRARAWLAQQRRHAA